MVDFETTISSAELLLSEDDDDPSEINNFYGQKWVPRLLMVPTHLPLDFNVNSKNFLPSFLHPFCSLIVKHNNEDPSHCLHCLLL
jgi:hypothetical protein